MEDKFKLLNHRSDNPTKGEGSFRSSLKSIEALEGITPADKASAVPYLLLWEIDPVTGKPMHASGGDGNMPRRPLSMEFVTPPSFGRSAENGRFIERPPVSLERVVVKTTNPRGIILYREIELGVTVHRPDLVFNIHVNEDKSHNGDGDEWESLITPGQAFAMEYGWSASSNVKNPLLNGEGVPRDRDVIIQDRGRVHFYVTRYTFQILPDMQLKFTIYGHEIGEGGLRRASLVPADDKDKDKDKGINAKNVDMRAEFAKVMNKLSTKFKNEVAANNGKRKKNKAGSVCVPLGLLFNAIYYDAIKDALVNTGYEFKGMFVGNFNSRVGIPHDKYHAGDTMSGKPISDFMIPIDDVTKIFADVAKIGEKITVYNFLEKFFNILNDSRTWSRKNDAGKTTKDGDERTVPQIVTRLITRRNGDKKMEAYFYVFDARHEFVKFAGNSDAKTPGGGTLTRSELRKKVLDSNVPYISLLKANSFIETSSFQNNMDPLGEAIFINRYFGDKQANRKQKTQQASAVNKNNSAPPSQQIFSPVIQGSITTIGNFVLDTFALIWLDFNVNRWDGPFNILNREDTIEPGKFTTTFNVISAGTDPFGTKAMQSLG